MMFGVAMYLLMMQTGGPPAADAEALRIPQPIEVASLSGMDERSLNANIAALNEQLLLAKEHLAQYERPFGGPGSNMPIASYDPTMFPIRTVPGSNCSNMPIYVWRPCPSQEALAQPLDASTFALPRSVDP